MGPGPAPRYDLPIVSVFVIVPQSFISPRFATAAPPPGRRVCAQFQAGGGARIVAGTATVACMAQVLYSPVSTRAGVVSYI